MIQVVNLKIYQSFLFDRVAPNDQFLYILQTRQTAQTFYIYYLIEAQIQNLDFFILT